MITVINAGGNTYEVTISARTTTVHRVTLDAEYHQKLTKGKVSQEELIKESFRFLLEREPNTSILRSFDLPLINSYFPEYEKTMSRMVS